MSKKNEIIKTLLSKYKRLKKDFYKNQFSHSKVLSLNISNKLYKVIIDSGFGITVVHNKKDIELLEYLLNKDYYDYGIGFSYLFIGDIMTFEDSDYKLNVFRKKIDSYFEVPSLEELDILFLIIDALHPVLKYYSQDINIVEQNADFYLDFIDETKEVSLKAYEFAPYDYFDGSFRLKNTLKHEPDGDFLTLIDMFNIELPVFSTERKKLINPYVLEIYNEKKHQRKLHLIPFEKNKAYETAIEILNKEELGSKICITNALLNKAISNMNLTNYSLSFEPLQYYRLNEIYTIEYNFYKEFSTKEHFFIDYDLLSAFIDSLNDCYSYIDKNYDGDSFDETMFESLNPELYDFFKRYIIAQDDYFILFESFFLNNQLFGNLYPYEESKPSSLEMNKNNDDDFELTECTLAA